MRRGTQARGGRPPSTAHSPALPDARGGDAGASRTSSLVGGAAPRRRAALRPTRATVDGTQPCTAWHPARTLPPPHVLPAMLPAAVSSAGWSHRGAAWPSPSPGASMLRSRTAHHPPASLLPRRLPCHFCIHPSIRVFALLPPSCAVPPAPLRPSSFLLTFTPPPPCGRRTAPAAGCPLPPPPNHPPSHTHPPTTPGAPPPTHPKTLPLPCFLPRSLFLRPPPHPVPHLYLPLGRAAAPTPPLTRSIETPAFHSPTAAPSLPSFYFFSSPAGRCDERLGQGHPS